jgi:hypothetical protein
MDVHNVEHPIYIVCCLHYTYDVHASHPVPAGPEVPIVLKFQISHYETTPVFHIALTIARSVQTFL